MEPEVAKLIANAKPAGLAEHRKANPDKQPQAKVTPEDVARPVVQTETDDGSEDNSSPVIPEGTVIQAEILRGGKLEPVQLTEETRGETIRRLTKRRIESQRLKDEKRPLSAIDQMFLSIGEQEIASLNKGELTPRQLAISYFELLTELYEKGISAGKLIKDQKIPPHYETRFKIFRHLVPGKLETKLVNAKTGLSTEYTKEGGYSGWNSERFINEIDQLNGLRQEIETAMFGQSFENPLFDQISTGMLPTEFLTKTGNAYHDKVVDQLMGTHGVLTLRYPGENIESLLEKNPTAALQSLHEAMEQALFAYSPQLAKELLLSQKPNGNLEAITKQIQQRENPETQKALDQATKEAGKASEGATKAEAKVETLRQQLENLKEQLPGKVQEYDDLESQLTTAEGRKDKTIDFWMKRLEAIDKRPASAPPAGLKDSDKADFIRAAEESKSAERQQIVQDIAKIHHGIEDLDIKVTQAKQVRSRLEAEIKRLEGENIIDPDSGEVTGNTGDIYKAEKILEAAIRTDEAQKADVEARKKEHEQGSAEAQKLRGWQNAATSRYGKVIETLFSEGYEGEFTGEELSNTAETNNGQLVGMENLRELILGTDLSPELRRQMLSNEAIAKAISWKYKLGNNQEANDLLSGIDNIRAIITIRRTEQARATSQRTQQRLQRQISALESQITRDIRNLSLQVLPSLNRSTFQTGELIRFVIDEGLISSAKGQSDLQIREKFTKPIAEMEPVFKAEVQSIYRQDIGDATITRDNQNRPVVTWESEVKDSQLARELASGVALLGTNAEMPLSFQIAATVNRENIENALQVKVDSSLLGMLPLTYKELKARIRTLSARNPALKEDTLKNLSALYHNGHLRTELRGGIIRRLISRERISEIPSWITVAKDSISDPNPNNIPNKLMNRSQEQISDESSVNFPSAVAAFFLEKTPDERQRTVPHLKPVYVKIQGVNTYAVQYNEGRLEMTNLIDNSHIDLEKFYENTVKYYKTNIFHIPLEQQLDETQRNQVKNALLDFQKELGKEIISSLQTI